MSEDATSQPSDPANDASATEDDDNQAQQLLVDAVESAGDPQTGDDTKETAAEAKPEKGGEDKLGDSGKRALASERKARRDAERQLTEMRNRLQHFEDRDKTDLQKAVERAEAFERDLTNTRTANARLMAAATYNIHPDLIELLGSGTDEEIDARAKLLAERLAAATPAPTADTPEQPRPAPRRPVESLTPGAKPASAEPEDMDAVIRRMAGRGP